MECRKYCGACCIAPSISSSIPGMPKGKPAGVRCVQLNSDNSCRLFGLPERPKVCSSLKPSKEMCGEYRQFALEYLYKLEELTKSGGINMGKILVFMYNDMADFEITYATHLLGHELSKEIVPCAYEKNTIKSKGGLLFAPIITVAEAKADDYEGFLIPGGWNPVVKTEILDLIKAFYTSGKLVAAICAGPRYLAKAGILDDVKYTTSIVEWTQARREAFNNEDDPFPRENFIDTRVVRDKNVITSKGISFVDFAIEIADYFGMFKEADDKEAFYDMITGK